MGPRKPEVEYISLKKLQLQKQRGKTDSTKEAYSTLRRLADGALKSGPFSITIGKTAPHVAPSGDVCDFLSYAPYWWPENPNNPNTKYIRKDGKRNTDIGCVNDQSQLESVAENLTYLCLGYYLLDNATYADFAVSLIDAFFLNPKTRMNPNLDYAQLVRGSQNKKKIGRGEGVISARVLSRISNLLPLLESFQGYKALKREIEVWFGKYLVWLRESPVAKEASRQENNVHTWYIVQMASIEQYLQPVSPQASNLIFHFFEHKFPKQIDASTGDQPLESKRAKPFHYLAFNMQAVIFLAELALDSGLDLYQSNNLLHLAAKHITRFSTNPDEDITPAVRCIEIIYSKSCDEDGNCKRFIDAAYHCNFADKIGGSKNAINVLWSS